MRFFAALLTLGSLAFSAVAVGNEVPRFTPNVVDETATLSAGEIAEINGTIEEIRQKADIWSAVLIVEQLQDDTIESLAEKAFRTWKLGDATKDNGLLLVLAMKDRKSRLEVGYGLEGDLPDALARRALDGVLRPYMRHGQVKTAIVETLLFMASQKAKGVNFNAVELPERASRNGFATLNRNRAFIALGIFYFLLWFLYPVTQLRALSLARRLEKAHAKYRLGTDPRLDRRGSFREVFLGAAGIGGLAIRGFLTINPGMFVFVGAGLSTVVFAILSAIFALIAVLYYRTVTRHYRSVEAYDRYLEKLRRKNELMVAKGFMREVAPGQYEFTPAWFASAEHRAWRRSSSSRSSSSSSRSSSSSSSGGGRSGGGGSSSSW